MTEPVEVKELQAKLWALWSNRDFEHLASNAARSLMRDRGDWDPPHGVVPKRDLIRMAIGIPDSDTLPKMELARSAARTLSKPGDAAFVYGFGMGYTKLRALLAERYSRDRGLPVSDDWFQLTNGSAGAIDLICRTLINPGDVIIAESPTYMGTLRNFKGVMADVRPVAMDEHGIRIDQLESLVNELKSKGRVIKMIYTISTFHNPTGATLEEARRLRLLELAAKHDILILDDDAYGELYFGERPPRALSTLGGGHGVITVGTFSKILATGLRVGWIHGEPKLVELMGKMRFAMGLNQLIVRIIADYMEDGQLDIHVEQVRALYKNKMNLLADALTYHAGEFVEFARPKGGFYLWIKLTGGLNTDKVWRTATHEGVAFTPGTNFFPSRLDPGGEHLRIAFPLTPTAQLEE
ncbi:MAG: PLP-dependent aminotransferase family protein, partial [Pseudomonadales bacterium]